MMISLIIDTTVNSLHVCVNDYLLCSSRNYMLYLYFLVLSGVCKQQGTKNVFKENGETDNRLTKKTE